MPVLKPTKLKAVITFLGVNTDDSDLCTSPITDVKVSYAGFDGDSHSGETRRSCVRVVSQYPKGTEIRNTRQISALSAEELNEIKTTMTLDELDPCWVGANMVVSGIHDFSELPPSCRLIAPNGTALVVDMQNAPCKFPGEQIEIRKPGKGHAFPAAAVGKRGVTLWVENQGLLAVGDELTLHVPPVCEWTANS